MIAHLHPASRQVNIYSETSISCGQHTVSGVKDTDGNEKYMVTAFKKLILVTQHLTSYRKWFYLDLKQNTLVL